MIAAHQQSRIKTKLNEGMRSGDLNDMIVPLISVDEYESKIDNDKAVVIGFYVHDENAAKDLNRFLQKSFVSTLDTDISDAPDQHGYFLVFVELLNNEKFAKSVKSLLDDINPLANITEWKMRIRKTDGVLPFSEDALMLALKKARDADKRAAKKLAAKNEMLAFLAKSNLNSVRLDETCDELILDGGRSAQIYKILSFGTYQEVAQHYNIATAACGVQLHEAFRAQRLESLLGPYWNVSEIERKFLLTRTDTDLCILIQNLT